MDGDITRLLRSLRDREPGAADRLIPAVYSELRRLARQHLRRERPDHSLQATELVHEAYLRLVDQRRTDWCDRSHFFGVAAHLMRLILVDHARRRGAVRHGGGLHKVTLDKVNLFAEEQYEELIALDEAIERLAAIDERMVQVVEMRFFADLSVEETAEALGVSVETVKRDWRLARPWLYAELARGATQGS
jgi:RNA polymerase sigma factor (TIGR02999 family)